MINSKAIKESILKNNFIYLPIFILSVLIILFIQQTPPTQSILDLILLLSSLLIRKEIYLYQDKIYKIDLFLPILIVFSLSYSPNYWLLLCSTAIVIVYIIEKLTPEEERKKDILLDQLYKIQDELKMQKLDQSLLEYTVLFVSISITISYLGNIPVINNFTLILILLITFIILIKKIFEFFFTALKKNVLNKNMKNLLSSYSIKSFKNFEFSLLILEIFIHFCLSFSLFYALSNSKIFIILITICLYLFLKNTIINQILTFLVMLVDLVEKKDRYTFDHSRRVALTSYNIAKELNLELEDIYKIYKAALIHDFGKIIVPDHILHKKGKLTNEEFEIVKLHVKELKNILNSIYPLLKEIIDIAELHHEKLDGSGYYNYKDNQIPLESRIIAIADIFDALVIDRPYRPGLPINRSLSIIMEEAENNKLDKIIAEKFLNTISNNQTFESIKHTKLMLRSFQGKIIQNFVEKLNFIDDLT